MVKINEKLKEDLIFQIELYEDASCDDDENSIEKEYGPLFGYLYIRDYLCDTIYPEIENEEIKKLINELDGIISGDDKRYSNSYRDTMNAVERCDDILSEIKSLVEGEDEEE